MPRLSAWFIRASLVYLAVGFTLGSLMLVNEGLHFGLRLDELLPAHMEFLFVGWMLQLALAAAYWILPRYGQGPPRGNEPVAWLSFLFLNIGILLVASGTLVGSPWFAVLGRILEVVCVLAFLSISWRRVRPLRESLLS